MTGFESLEFKSKFFQAFDQYQIRNFFFEKLQIIIKGIAFQLSRLNIPKN